MVPACFGFQVVNDNNNNKQQQKFMTHVLRCSGNTEEVGFSQASIAQGYVQAGMQFRLPFPKLVPDPDASGDAICGVPSGFGSMYGNMSECIDVPGKR
jgi:hypothetical protein